MAGVLLKLVVAVESECLRKAHDRRGTDPSSLTKLCCGRKRGKRRVLCDAAGHRLMLGTQFPKTVKIETVGGASAISKPSTRVRESRRNKTMRSPLIGDPTADYQASGESCNGCCTSDSSE